MQLAGVGAVAPGVVRFPEEQEDSVPKFTICTYPSGCPNLAPVGIGRCDEHPRERPWTRKSKRNQDRPSNYNSLVRMVRKRDKNKCQICGAPGIQVDHKLAIADGGTWDPRNLWCLCEFHHKNKTNLENARRAARNG